MNFAKYIVAHISAKFKYFAKQTLFKKCVYFRMYFQTFPRFSRTFSCLSFLPGLFQTFSRLFHTGYSRPGNLLFISRFSRFSRCVKPCLC